MALVLYVATPSPEQPWLDEAVSSHVRSLMAATVLVSVWVRVHA